MRFDTNPLITPADVAPTHDGYRVVSVLNPAVTRYDDELLLLLRVAEQAPQADGLLRVTVLDENNDYAIREFRCNDPKLDNTDPRVAKYEGVTHLTSISHLRLARSRDGMDFTIDPKPLLAPEGPDEECGIEDARITRIGDVYYIYYVAASRRGVTVRLAQTRDFLTVQKGEIIFAPNNKDVAILPERIGGRYWALHRPCTDDFTPPAMWLASSDNLIDWGRHQYLMGPRPGRWDSGRVGAGTVPLKTDRGWLSIYHGADARHDYALGLLLQDLQDPARILFRSSQPLFKPDADYEKHGFFSNVVFTNGWAYFPERNGELLLYYGAADERVCGARLRLDELLATESTP